jgi:hypothetical protein
MRDLATIPVTAVAGRAGSGNPRTVPKGECVTRRSAPGEPPVNAPIAGNGGSARPGIGPSGPARANIHTLFSP